MNHFIHKTKSALQCNINKFFRLILLHTFIKWIFLGCIVGILSGSASALFLVSLEYVTQLRLNQPWLLLLLPLGGAFISFIYLKYGKNSIKGNNLILEQIHHGNDYIYFRMAPLVLFGTLVTHLFGGSAGREGTAVQMGGSISEYVGKIFKVTKADRRTLLMSGMSSGFGSVFGTPLAGAIFGMEVISVGSIRYGALIPCFTASFVGHLVTTAWGIRHANYTMGLIPDFEWLLAIKVILGSMAFGLTSVFFSQLTHMLKKIFSHVCKNPMIKSFVGGIMVIVFVSLLGTRDYLGLGIPLISSSFKGEADSFAFLWKTIFTSITLGAGFQGGEVTPLFVIGATLGNTLSGLLQVSAPFFAGLGLIAVFCGATNAPFASFILGIELFGAEGILYMFLACTISYFFSGHGGIYTSQEISVSKYDSPKP